MNFGIEISLAACFAATAFCAAAPATPPSVAAPPPVAASGAAAASNPSADSLRAYTLPPITVYGPRVGLDRLAPFGATLRRRGEGPGGSSPDVTPLVDAAPGVEVRRQGGPGAPAWLAIRGSNADQVLVLVDGVPLNTAQGGGVDLALLPAEGIGAAEILRGPAAALWGAGALAGVVHFITLPRALSEVSVSAERGSFGSESLSGSLSEVRGASSVLVRAGRTRSAGDFRYDDGRRPAARERENADFGRDHVDLNVRRDRAGRLWESRLSLISARRGMPGTIEFPSASAEQSDREVRGLFAVRAQGESPWPGRGGCEIALLDRWRRYHDPSSPWSALSERHHDRRVETRFLWSASGARTALEAALAPSWERLESTGDGRRVRRAVSSVVRVQRSFGPGNAGGSAPGRAAATLRSDAATSFAPSWDPAVGLSYEVVRDRASVSVSAARTRRVPSFDDLFWPASAFVAGNPDLRPERAISVDAGARVSAADVDLTAGVFRSEVTDLIQWAPSGGGRWRPHNVGRALLRGIEAEIAAARRLGKSWTARATASGTLLDAFDRTAGAHGGRLPRRARLWGGASLAVERGGLSLRLLVDAVSKRYLNTANTKELPARMTADLMLQAPLVSGLAAALEVRNVADRAYVDVADYPVPGREWSLRLRYTHRHGGGER